MEKLLNRSTTETQIAEMWDDINRISDEDLGKHEAAQEGIKVQQRLLKQLDTQDKVLPLLWEAIHIINPENPLAAALQISANAERLTPVLKSYQLAPSI